MIKENIRLCCFSFSRNGESNLTVVKM